MYRLFTPLPLSLPAHRCLYCGVLGDARDHYRPWSIFREPWWVRSCSWCNTSLADRVDLTFGDRCRRIEMGLRRHHKRILQLDYEYLLDGTEGALRRTLEADRARRDGVAARIQWSSIMAVLTRSVLLEDLHERQEDQEVIESAVRMLLEDLSEFDRSVPE